MPIIIKEPGGFSRALFAFMTSGMVQMALLELAVCINWATAAFPVWRWGRFPHGHGPPALFEFLGLLDARIKRHERVNRLPLDRVRIAGHRRFGDTGMGNQSRLDLGGAHAVAGHIDHIVRTPAGGSRRYHAFLPMNRPPWPAPGWPSARCKRCRSCIFRRWPRSARSPDSWARLRT